MRNAAALLCALFALAATLHATEFKSIYRPPRTEAISFAGRKVVALVIADDTALRMSAEESLARVLVARGTQGVAAYRLIPPEELRDAEQAKRWFAFASVDGIVVLRPVGVERETTRSAPQWTTSYYDTFWGYYSYGWTAAWRPGSSHTDTTVVVETLVYDVPRDSLLWAAVSETTNPKSMDAYMRDLVGDAVKEMQKAGLIPRAR